jgi:hypothetical protein
MYNANANAARGSHSFSHPNQWALMLHIGKTFALVRSVLADPRVHWLPKGVFLGTIGTLLLALLGGDTVAGAVEAFIPIVGPLVGWPADAGLDWVAFAVAAFNLLRLFPADVVGEHYDRLFRANRRAA